jgi:putative hemolysin
MSDAGPVWGTRFSVLLKTLDANLDAEKSRLKPELRTRTPDEGQSVRSTRFSVLLKTLDANLDAEKSRLKPELQTKTPDEGQSARSTRFSVLLETLDANLDAKKSRLKPELRTKTTRHLEDRNNRLKPEPPIAGMQQTISQIGDV